MRRLSSIGRTSAALSGRAVGLVLVACTAYLMTAGCGAFPASPSGGAGESDETAWDSTSPDSGWTSTDPQPDSQSRLTDPAPSGGDDDPPPGMAACSFGNVVCRYRYPDVCAGEGGQSHPVGTACTAITAAVPAPEVVLALLGDSDNDGRSDLDELVGGFDLFDPTDGPDIDGDGIPNAEDPIDDVAGIFVGEVTIARVERDLPIPSLTQPELPDSLPPGVRGRRGVKVTIKPSLVGTPYGIHFDIVPVDPRKQDAAKAKVILNENLKADGTITIEGTAQTSRGVGPGLRIRATLDGQGPAIVYSKPFAVCAHPTKWELVEKTRDVHIEHDPHNIDHQPLRCVDRGALMFLYTWNSDSDDLLDLDEVYDGEHVSYTTPHPKRWVNWPQGPDNPQVHPPRHLFGAGPKSGFCDDAQLNNICDPESPILECMVPGHSGITYSFTGTQYWRFRCYRCNLPKAKEPKATEDFKKLEWGTILRGPHEILRVIEQKPGSENWHYTVTKEGCTATRDLGAPCTFMRKLKCGGVCCEAEKPDTPPEQCPAPPSPK